MNGGGETAARSSSAQVVELGQEEAGSSPQPDVPEKAPEVVVIAIDGSKQAETAFACTLHSFLSKIINGLNQLRTLLSLFAIGPVSSQEVLLTWPSVMGLA